MERALADPTYAARIRQLALAEDYNALTVAPPALLDGMDGIRVTGTFRPLPTKNLMPRPPFEDLVGHARALRRSLDDDAASTAAIQQTARRRDNPGDTMADLRTLLGLFASSTDDLAELLPPFDTDERFAADAVTTTTITTTTTIATTFTVTTAACTVTTTTTTTFGTTTTGSHFCPHLKKVDDS